MNGLPEIEEKLLLKLFCLLLETMISAFPRTADSPLLELNGSVTKVVSLDVILKLDKPNQEMIIMQLF